MHASPLATTRDERSTEPTGTIAPPAHAIDTLSLYRWAVQDPETHAVVLDLMHRHAARDSGEPWAPVDLSPSLLAAGRTGGTGALVLREDFAGTAADSVAWLALDPDAAPRRRAWAVDLDPHTLAWATARAARLLGPRAAHLTPVVGDATALAPPDVPHADIIAALNFSALYLRDQVSLDAYLRTAARALAPRGILVLNLFGGADALRCAVTTTRVTPRPRLQAEATNPPFDYHWEVRAFNPCTRELECRIHFTLDPRQPGQPPHHLRSAFTYRWRMWSPGEVLHACARAGFAVARVWRHTATGDPGQPRVFLGPVPAASLDQLPAWTAYVVAQRDDPLDINRAAPPIRPEEA